MKYLRINSGKGEFSVDGSNWSDIDKIGKEDLLRLMSLSLKENFEMDPYDKTLLPNPAQEIVYRNLHGKLGDLCGTKERFKDESQRLYSEAIRKYKV